MTGRDYSQTRSWNQIQIFLKAGASSVFVLAPDSCLRYSFHFIVFKNEVSLGRGKEIGSNIPRDDTIHSTLLGIALIFNGRIR